MFRVKLAVNRETSEAVAVKIVDLSKSASVEKNIRKEVLCSKRRYCVVMFCNISLGLFLSFFLLLWPLQP
jgi:hypothetical protein